MWHILAPEIDANSELQHAHSETCPIDFVGGNSSAEYILKYLIPQIPTVDGGYVIFSTSTQTNPVFIWCYCDIEKSTYIVDLPYFCYIFYVV